MNFTMTEITNKTVATRPESGLHGLNVNSNPFFFGPERNISYGWNWLGNTPEEIWNNRMMSHYAFGSVCVGRNNELYYVFRKATTHGVITDPTSPYLNVGGDLCYTVSYDFGETWEDPVMFLEHEEGRDLRDVTLSYYPDNDMYVLIYEDCSVDYAAHEGTMHILATPNLCRADSAYNSILDPFPISNMLEWTLPTEDMFTNLNQTFHRLVPLGSYFYLPFYGTDGTSYGGGLLRFPAGGIRIPTGTVLKKWDEDSSNECTFFTTFNQASGIIRFNMLFRGGNNAGTGDNATLSYSDDFGETWSEKQELGFNAAGGPQVFDIDGTLMLVARDQKNGMQYTYAMFSKDGQNWSNRIMLAHRGVSYASMAQLNNGRTLLFYTKELTKSIICMREIYGIPRLPDAT